MSRLFDRLGSFLTELKRRNVYRVAATYAVVAFVGFQAAKLLIPSTVLPAWTDEFFLFLLIIGFPVAVVVAWAFELTPEGVRRTSETEEAPEPESMSPEERRAQSRLAMKALIGLGLVGAAVAGGWYLMGSGGEPEAEGRAGDRSIAVLPFEALGQQEPGTFTEGMHDALLTRLSNVGGLDVISRTSVQQYRETDKTTAEIARDLGVKWVVEGGVQEMDEQIQVNAQLIDPRTDTHAWAESYRRDLTAASLFDLQSEITKKIANSLAGQLTADEEQRVERHPTESLEAYRAYLKGRYHWDRHTPEDWRKAADHYEEAIAIDSTYAPAFAGLADAIIRLAFYGHEAPGDSYRRARRAARRALQLDERLADAHTTLGRIQYLYDWDFQGAEEEFRRALELNPNYAKGHHAYAVFLVRMGRFRESEEALERALELDPVMPRFNNNRGWIAFLARDYQDAIEKYESALELNPRFAMTHRELAWAYVEVGRHREAIREAERAVQLSGGAYDLASLGYVLGRAGEGDRARAILDSLKARADQRYVSPTHLALPHLGLGNADRALDWLERAAEERSTFLVNLGVHPFFDPLRSNTRFQDLLERMDFPDTVVIPGASVSGRTPSPSEEAVTHSSPVGAARPE